MSDRKNSIKKKYNLESFEGRLGNEHQLMEETRFPMQISHEDLQVLTVGNLSSYTHSIKNDRVKNWLKSLVFSYKKQKEMSFDEKNK